MLPNIAATVNATLFYETANALRTAYFLTKERLAFSKTSSVVSLQEVIVAQMGPSHRSDHECINRIEHIAVIMRTTVISTPKNTGSRLNFTVD